MKPGVLINEYERKLKVQEEICHKSQARVVL